MSRHCEASANPPTSLTRLSHTPTTTTTTAILTTTIPATKTTTTALACEDGVGDDDNDDDADKDDFYLSGLRPLIAWSTSHGPRKSLRHSRVGFHVGCCSRSLMLHTYTRRRVRLNKNYPHYLRMVGILCILSILAMERRR